MLSNAQIKLVKSLHLKKNREQMHLFIAEGKKMVDELLASPHIEIVHIYASGDYYGNKPFTKVTEAEMKKISALTTPPNILAVCRIPSESSTIPDLDKELVLILDDIRDPGNLGTIIRIADWFGIKYIFCTAECVDAYNPKVVQASMGSIARIKVDYKNLRGVLQQCSDKQIKVYGAKLDGTNILNEQLNPNGVLIIGNESNGISPELSTYITNAIKIPSSPHGPSGGGAESLNAAMATAILCAEFRRNELKGI
ncbi:MAG TPA: RNA methyltransferase [Bacteroidia bacterium]|jgi:TrmH family RNA methyltransferase|nr:RNA methyltransferase [Bacteroidia bacterium]